MSKFLCFLLIPVLFVLSLFVYTTVKIPSCEKELFERVADPYHPTRQDYFLIQKYLLKGERSSLLHLKDYEERVRNFHLIGQGANETPQFGRVCVNCTEEEKENCVLLYASFNMKYPEALMGLLESIKQSDFRGHVLYRIGGWPNLSEGDLALACVPYAFKACFFKEAQKLGYTRALWLDTSIMPLVSLNEQFSWIKQKGYLAVGNTHCVGPFLNELSARSLGVTMAESFEIPSVSAGILGLDFTHDLALQALCLWYEAVKDPHAYFSARPEQNALSIILHKLGMTEWIGYDFVAEGAAKITPTSVYLLDRRVSRKGKGSRKKRVTEEAQKDPIPHNFDHTQARHLDQHGRSTLSAQRV